MRAEGFAPDNLVRKGDWFRPASTVSSHGQIQGVGTAPCEITHLRRCLAGIRFETQRDITPLNGRRCHGCAGNQKKTYTHASSLLTSVNYRLRWRRPAKISRPVRIVPSRRLSQSSQCTRPLTPAYGKHIPCIAPATLDLTKSGGWEVRCLKAREGNVQMENSMHANSRRRYFNKLATTWPP